jgi:hypothetical protein
VMVRFVAVSLKYNCQRANESMWTGRDCH